MITREQYQERIDVMRTRLETVNHDQDDEAKAAVDEYLKALGIKVELPPIWEREWTPRESYRDQHLTRIYCGDFHIADCPEESVVKFFMGAPALVKAALAITPGYYEEGGIYKFDVMPKKNYDAIIDALANMGVSTSKTISATATVSKMDRMESFTGDFIKSPKMGL